LAFCLLRDAFACRSRAEKELHKRINLIVSTDTHAEAHMNARTRTLHESKYSTTTSHKQNLEACIDARNYWIGYFMDIGVITEPSPTNERLANAINRMHGIPNVEMGKSKARKILVTNYRKFGAIGLKPKRAENDPRNRPFDSVTCSHVMAVTKEVNYQPHAHGDVAPWE